MTTQIRTLRRPAPPATPGLPQILHIRGNWYAFTVGSIRVISLNNDDVCLQDGGFSGSGATTSRPM